MPPVLVDLVNPDHDAVSHGQDVGVFVGPACLQLPVSPNGFVYPVRIVPTISVQPVVLDFDQDEFGAIGVVVKDGGRELFLEFVGPSHPAVRVMTLDAVGQAGQPEEIYERGLDLERGLLVHPPPLDDVDDR